MELHLIWVATLLQSTKVLLEALGISGSIHCSIMMESSPNNLMFDLTSVTMSLINNKNRMGPRTEPWGTPEVTGMLSQEEPSTTTCWEHTLRKSSMQFRFLTRILYLLRLVRSLPCETLSKALLKSITMQSTYLWAESIVWKSWPKSMSWVSNDRPSLKPCCSGMRIPISMQQAESVKKHCLLTTSSMPRSSRYKCVSLFK